MSKIINEAKIKNPLVVKIRELLEHRAFWLYLLNGLLVATDTVLCLYYQHRNKKKAGLVKAEEQTV